MLADVFGCPVKTAASKEGPALGVAILAMVGAGEYPSIEAACRTIVGVDRIQEPVRDHTDRYQVFYRFYQELYPALKEKFAALADLG